MAEPTPLKVVEVKGRQYALGRKTPAKTEPLFRFSPVLAATVPTPPVTLAAIADAARANVFNNDRLGDCVIADQYHFFGNITALAGSCFVGTSAQVIHDYEQVGGYNPLNPFSDNGCNIGDAMAYYVATGYPNGAKNAGYFQLDPTNTTAFKQIIWLTGGACIGASMPNDWVGKDMPQADGFVWDVAGSPNDGNGHCFEAVGYTAAGVLINTWGMVGTLTWAAVAKYLVSHAGGELWARVNQAMMPASGKSAAGFSWADTITYFDALGGTIVVPPNPNPTPNPTPTPTVINVPLGLYTIGSDGTNLTLTPYVATPAPTAATTINFPAPVSSIEISSTPASK